jgi:hypothetical protein
MNIFSSCVRILLTLFLIFGAWTETGTWTALSLFLIFLNTEMKIYETKIYENDQAKEGA